MSKKRLNKIFAVMLAITMIGYVGFGSKAVVNNSVGATTVTVCKPSGCDYTEIQAAIDYVDSQGGGTVNVESGTYSERITLRSGVDVVGESAGTTFISGPSVGPVNEKVTGASNVNFSGFTVTGGSYGIYNSGVSPVLFENVFTGNSIEGIRNVAGAAPRIYKNVITANPIGIATVGGGDSIIIESNRIYSNSATGVSHDSTKGLIFDNEFYSNVNEGLKLITSEAYVTFNTFKGPSQADGISVNGGGPNIIDNVIGDISSPLTSNGIQVKTSDVSGLYISGNRIEYSQTQNIAIDVAGNSTIIGNRILNSATNNGLHLTGSVSGTTTIQDNYISGNSLAGIYVGSGWTATIVGNKITGNAQGVLDNACTSNITTTYNLIYSNSSEGYVVGAGSCASAPTISHNVIDSNGTHGISTSSFSTVTITTNQITNNTTTGIYKTGGAAATVGYNNVYGNGTNYTVWTAGTGDTSFNPLYLKDNATALTPAYALQSQADGYGDGTSPTIDKAAPTPTYEDKYRPPGRGAVRGDIGAYGGQNIQKPTTNPTDITVAGQSVTGGSTINVGTDTPEINGNTGIDDTDAGKSVRVYVNGELKGQDTDLDYNCTTAACTNANGKRSNFSITPSSFGTSGTYTVSVRTANQMDLESDGVAFTVNVDLGTGGQLSSSVNSLPETTTSAQFDIFYTASAGPSGLKGVELYYRKGNSGSFTKYTDSSHATGLFTSSPITFDSEKVGGDGLYQFYSLAVDNVDHTEAAPSGYDAYTNVVAAGTGAPGQINDLEISNWDVTASTVDLTWTAPSTSGGAAAEYDIRYLHSYITESNWDEGTRISYNLTPGTPGDRQSITMPVNASGTAGRKVDLDADGLTDYMELFLWGSSPVNQDTDGDSYHDATETYNNFSPLFPYPYRPDQDNDTLLDMWEERHGLDPTDPDTDGDGYKDNVEKDNKYDPRNANPRSNLFDYDHDKLTDYEERYIFGTNPASSDSDNDGYDDYTEVHAGYDPVKVYCFGIKSKDVAGNTSTISNRACRYIY